MFYFIRSVKERGYHFADGEIHPLILSDLEAEASKLDFQVGDHVNYPINANTKTEVKQLHERAYYLLNAPEVPVASALCYALKESASFYTNGDMKELESWLPNEIGYQRYRGITDWISPHRDRRSDRLLSVTITISGQARVNVYKSPEDPPNYSNLIKVDEHLTKPGTVMLLRAPGLGSGEQIIHEVSPPLDGPRLIINLRMRGSVLQSPVNHEETHL